MIYTYTVVEMKYTLTGKDWNKPLFQMIQEIAARHGFTIIAANGNLYIEADPEEVEAEMMNSENMQQLSFPSYINESEAVYRPRQSAQYQPKIYDQRQDPTLLKIRQLEEEKNKQMMHLADRYGRERAAGLLGISESTLHRKLAKIRKGQGKTK